MSTGSRNKRNRCPVRGAVSADNKHIRKGSWARRGEKDVKLVEESEAENEKRVVERETGTREGE